MHHVDDVTAMALAEGNGADSAADHAAGCARCQALVADYRRVLATVHEVAERGAPPEGLMRWAKAYASTRRARQRSYSPLALLGGGAPLVPAVRGGLAEIALLYGDDAHHLDLRVDPHDDDRARLHGHMVRLAGEPARDFEISVVTSSGTTHRTRTGATGEFWIDNVPDWKHASLVAVRKRQRLVVARLGSTREAGHSS